MIPVAVIKHPTRNMERKENFPLTCFVASPDKLRTIMFMFRTNAAPVVFNPRSFKWSAKRRENIERRELLKAWKIKGIWNKFILKGGL